MLTSGKNHVCGNIDKISVLSFLGQKYLVGEIRIEGWLADSMNRTAMDEVYVCFNDMVYKAQSGHKRFDVAYVKSCFDFNNCGFRLQLSSDSIQDGNYKISIQGTSRLGLETKSLVFPETYRVSNHNTFLRLLACLYKVKNYLVLKARFLKGFIKEKCFFPSLIKNIAMILFVRLTQNNRIIINLEERIGDIIACEPVPRLIRRDNPKAYIIWITRYSNIPLVKYNSCLDRVLGVTSIYEWSILKRLFSHERIVDLLIDKKPCTAFGISLNNPNKYGITLDNYYHHGNLLEISLMSANMDKDDLSPTFYGLKPIPMPAHGPGYIVIHGASAEPTRNWQTERWTELAQELIRKDYTVCEVGTSQCIYLPDEKRYVNYCGLLSLQETAYVISNCCLFIGIDSALVHVANALNIPGVILLGYYRAFKQYMPYSGRYKNGENATIIQYDGYAKDIPLELVHKAAVESLRRKGAR